VYGAVARVPIDALQPSVHQNTTNAFIRVSPTSFWIHPSTVTATFFATLQMELVAFHISLRLNHVLWISLTRA
jgi:hypothetical protein